MAEKNQPDCDQATVARLVRELQTGGSTEASAHQLFRCYYRPVRYFFRKRGYSSESCHDLAQETFLRAFQNLGSFQHDSSFDTWLFSIAGNVWKNELRGRSTQKRGASEIPLDGETGREIEDSAVPNPEGRLLELEQARLEREEVRQALHELPPQMRRASLLRFDQGLKYREIADILGVKINTVKSLLHEAKKRLGQKLGKRFSELDS